MLRTNKRPSAFGLTCATLFNACPSSVVPNNNNIFGYIFMVINKVMEIVKKQALTRTLQL